MSPGFPQTQPPRFTPDGGPGKLRPVSIKVPWQVFFDCFAVRSSWSTMNSLIFISYTKTNSVNSSSIRLLSPQVRAAPPPPKQQPRRQQAKSDKTEEVEITLVWQRDELAGGYGPSEDNQQMTDRLGTNTLWTELSLNKMIWSKPNWTTSTPLPSCSTSCYAQVEKEGSERG